MLVATPGYCTLIASVRPSRVSALWTCPMDAAAIGRGSNRRNCLRQSGPHWSRRTLSSCLGGMKLALSRNCPRISVSSGGKTSPASMLIICPSFIAAPRKWLSRSVTRLILPGVSSNSSILGRSPAASLRAPSASIPPATPPAIRPKPDRRDKRPLGTELSRSLSERVLGGGKSDASSLMMVASAPLAMALQ